MSSDAAVCVEDLGKRYLIGEMRSGYRTIRETITDGVKAPFKRAYSLMRGQAYGAAQLEEEIWALRHIFLEVGVGEVLGIIGQNGAGKTTLLKVLSRITEPTEGFAEIRGRVGSLLEVGTGIHPELTGRENIFLNGAVLGMKRAEIKKKFDEIVDFSGIAKFIDTPVKHYSDGMRVRLAFSVAAHLEPEILLVDEVLAVGDAAFQKKCLGKMRDVSKGGRTVLFVSHNMSAIRSLCPRAILLSGGQIVLSGTAGECIDRYLVKVSEDMSAEINTAELPRPPGVAHDESLRITKLRLDTPTGRAVLYTGKPITLVMQFESIEPLEDVLFGMSVHSSDNVRIFECRSIESYGTVSRLDPGTYSVRCTLPSNPLNPGLYTIHVGSRCAKKSLDWLPDVMTIRVDSPEQLDSLWLEKPSGLMNVESEWSEPVGDKSR